MEMHPLPTAGNVYIAVTLIGEIVFHIHDNDHSTWLDPCFLQRVPQTNQIQVQRMLSGFKDYSKCRALPDHQVMVVGQAEELLAEAYVDSIKRFRADAAGISLSAASNVTQFPGGR